MDHLSWRFSPWTAAEYWSGFTVRLNNNQSINDFSNWCTEAKAPAAVWPTMISCHRRRLMDQYLCWTLTANLWRVGTLRTHLAAEHEGDGTVGARHLAVTQHRRETLCLLHVTAARTLHQQTPPAGALPARLVSPGSNYGSHCTSSSTTAAVAPCSHHPPSFLTSLQYSDEGMTLIVLPSFTKLVLLLLTPPPSGAIIYSSSFWPPLRLKLTLTVVPPPPPYADYNSRVSKSCSVSVWVYFFLRGGDCSSERGDVTDLVTWLKRELCEEREGV